MNEPFRIGNALTLLALFRVQVRHFDATRAALAEAMAIWRSAGDMPNIVNALLIGAHGLVAEGRAASAAELSSAIDALREPMGDVASGLDILSIPDPRIAARAALGEEAYAAAAARGRVLDLDGAIAVALAVDAQGG